MFLMLSGCGHQRTSKQVSSLDNNDAVIQRLRNEKLPALKAVEKWQSSYGKGIKLTTAHYEIYTTLSDPLMLRQIPSFIECAYRAYQLQLSEPVYSDAIYINKLRIYLFSNREQWDDFTKSFVGKNSSLYLKIKAGAYYLNGACVAYNIGRERTFSVLGHEGWHQFNSRLSKYRLPSWLDEGIAMLFENSRYEKGLFYFEPDRNLYRLGSLKKTLLNRKMIPLRRLVSINPGEVLATDDQSQVAAFYAQAYALIRFLKEEGYGKRLHKYHWLLEDGFRGNWPLTEEYKKIAIDRNIPLTIGWNRTLGLQLFENYIADDSDLAELEQEYVRFCRKIVYHIHFK